MSSGFYYVSGIMYLNMGCQVIFVLTNRMKAQNIDTNVGSKILCDIILQMFKPSFIQSILKPQLPLSMPVIYEIFTKMVNSSMMKLDKSSMEKLFYLILMTFKKQIFSLSSPLQIFTLTLTHLQDVADLQKNSSQSQSCMQHSMQVWKQESSKFSYTQYLDFKQEILSMLETYKSKIVLFCETGSQQQNGNLIFAPRNVHNRKNIGIGQNHPDIDFPPAYAWAHTKNLQYSNFRNWKTILGKDDYDNARGSSKVLESKIKKQISQQNSKSVSDMLGIKNMKVDSYQVHIDIFANQKESKPKADKKQTVKTVEAGQQEDIKKKILKQFDGLQLEDKNKEDDIDLLQLMDS